MNARSNKTVAIFSYHLYEQHRKGGMHWICNSLLKAGWTVRFITCDFSLITRIKGDRRTEYGRAVGWNQLEPLGERLLAGIISTPWHPIGSSESLVGRALDLLTSTYPWPQFDTIRKFSLGTDLVILESCGALMMIDAIRSATRGPIVYRVSDNLQVVRPVPSLLAAESRAVTIVDLVSVASEYLARRFHAKGNVRVDPMGLDKVQFNQARTNPYANDGRPKVIISGSSGLDCEALEIASRSLPNWDFIQFGSAHGLPQLPNVISMGERPFNELVPWVKFADIGFAPYLARPGFEYQAEHSNRLLQYTYSGLPSVVPLPLASSSRPHFIGYIPGNQDSIVNALLSAYQFDRRLVPADSVLDWDQLAARLASVARISRPHIRT